MEPFSLVQKVVNRAGRRYCHRDHVILERDCSTPLRSAVSTCSKAFYAACLPERCSACSAALPESSAMWSNSDT
ncbi:hypothetical protein IWQ49_002977 [Labrenzia sp. EL_126]|nr:hypothetical protein [Labrenzia sp. EL_126]